VSSSKFEVIWSEVAVRDLERIVEDIADDSSINAERVLDRLEHAAESLSTLPVRGRVVPELKRLEVTSIRELVVRPWRLVYRIGTKQVLVVGVFDSRRDLELVLLARITGQ
jgi:toxin ParE1/3/4